MIGGSIPSGKAWCPKYNSSASRRLVKRDVETFPLSRYLHLETAGDVPGRFMRDGGSKTHTVIVRAARLCRR
jgi:hypothetical protein